MLLFISHTASCIVSHVSLGHRVISYSLRCLGSFLTLAVPDKQTLWSKFKIFGVPILVTHIMKFLVTTQVPQIQVEKQNRYAFAAPHFLYFPFEVLVVVDLLSSVFCNSGIKRTCHIDDLAHSARLFHYDYIRPVMV